MEDFKVVEVTPHGHVDEHHIHHVNNNTEDLAYAVPFVDRNRRYVEDYVERKLQFCCLLVVQLAIHYQSVRNEELVT